MKYIRTKYGIYEIDETTILTSLPPCYKVIKPTDKHYAINERQVIKSADTIEELCDYVFYRFIEDNELEIKKIKKVNMKVLKSWYKNNIVKDVMFAILTDKGLIYVAKMNDKGELELL